MLRLLIAPFTLNWDLLGHVNTAREFSFTALPTFYEIPIATHPPITYIWLKSAIAVASFFTGGQLSAWLGLGAADAFTAFNIFKILLFLKLPTIILDLVNGFLVSRLVDKKYSMRALFIWMVNPAVIFLVSAWTNVDTPAVFAMLLALFMYKKGQVHKATIALGLGTSLKLLPAFIAPLFILSGKSLREKLSISAVFLTSVVLTQGPALLLPQYRQHALSGGYREHALFATLHVGDQRFLVVAAFVYILIVLHAASKRFSRDSISIYAFFTFLPLFILSAFSLQWFLWLIPFLVIFQATFGLTLELTLVYLAYFTMVFTSQSSLNIGMLAPVEPSLWMLAWPLKTKIGNNVYTILNYAHTLFAASIVWLGYKMYKKSEKNYATPR